MGAAILNNSTKRTGQTRIRAQGGLPVVEEIYHYIVLADSVDEPYSTVRSASGLPAIGSQFGVLTCVGIDCERRENASLYWDVTVTFSTQVSEGQDSFDPNSDPIFWVPVRETKLERMQELVTKDLDDKVVANSAGQPFEVSLLVHRWVPYWEFYQFEAASVTDETIADRCEVTNSATYKGKDAGKWLLTVESSVLGFYYGYRRRLTFYTLRYNKNGWKHKRLDVGTMYKDDSVNPAVWKPAMDDDNVSVHLMPLDGNGALQAAGTAPAEIEFRVHEETNFNSFLRI